MIVEVYQTRNWPHDPYHNFSTENGYKA